MSRQEKKITVIFDMDGVLIDTVAIHWNIYNDLLRPYNIHIDESKISKYIGKTLEDQLIEIEKEYGVRIDRKKFTIEAALRKEKALVNIQPKQGLLDCLKN